MDKAQLNYTLTYYDEDWNELSGAPSKAGTYQVLAELIPTGDKQYATDFDGINVWEIKEDETVDDEGYVCDASGNEIGYLIYDPVQEVKVGDTAYHIPRVRGWATYTIQPAAASNSGTSDVTKPQLPKEDTPEDSPEVKVPKSK